MAAAVASASAASLFEWARSQQLRCPYSIFRFISVRMKTKVFQHSTAPPSTTFLHIYFPFFAQWNALSHLLPISIEFCAHKGVTKRFQNLFCLAFGRFIRLDGENAAVAAAAAAALSTIATTIDQLTHVVPLKAFVSIANCDGTPRINSYAFASDSTSLTSKVNKNREKKKQKVCQKVSWHFAHKLYLRFFPPSSPSYIVSLEGKYCIVKNRFHMLALTAKSHLSLATTAISVRELMGCRVVTCTLHTYLF